MESQKLFPKKYSSTVRPSHKSMTKPVIDPNPIIRPLYENSSLDNALVSVDQQNAHDARAIVLTCMDFRLLDDIVNTMDKLGYNNNYDQFILAGGALSYVNDDVDNLTKNKDLWRAVFDEHVDLASKLHNIKEIIAFDHMNCGAYKAIYGEMTEDEERHHHRENIKKFMEKIHKKYNNKTLSGFVMNLDGSAEHIGELLNDNNDNNDNNDDNDNINK